MNKVTVLAGTGAIALVVAATATTPALAYQGHHDYQTSRHSTSQESGKKNCPPKKNHETPKTPPKHVEHKKKNCQPKHVEKQAEKPVPQQAPTPEPVEVKPVSTVKPEAPKELPKTGA